MASIIQRIKTWGAEVLKSSDLNAEFNNVVNVINNVNSGSTVLTSPQASALTMLGNIVFNPTTAGLTGTTTSDSAPTGTVGEFVFGQVIVGSRISAGSTGTFANIVTIQVTAGDWDVAGIVQGVNNGATMTGLMLAAVSGYSANTTTDESDGYNTVKGAPPASNSGVGTDVSLSIPMWRVQAAVTLSLFLKAQFSYSGGPPQMFGSIMARRRR